MTQIITSSSTEHDLVAGKLWTVGHTSEVIAASGSVIYGITTGARQVIYQARTYGGTCSSILVELFLDPFTGGVLIPARNRNLAIKSAGPALHYRDIVGSPTNLETSLRVYGEGTAGVSGLGSVPEGEWYLLEAMKNYILRLTNTGAGNGVINFRFTYKQTD